MFKARRIHTMVWDIIQGRRQEGGPLGLRWRDVNMIPIGVPFFSPGTLIHLSNVNALNGHAPGINDEQRWGWIEKHLMNEPILIDFEPFGFMCISNRDDQGMEIFGTDFLRESNMLDGLYPRYGIEIEGLELKILEVGADSAYAKTSREHSVETLPIDTPPLTPEQLNRWYGKPPRNPFPF